MRSQTICIVGFMGAGKSLIARLLAFLLGWRFVDIDDLFEDRHGPISAFFPDRVSEFRRLERKLLRELLRRGNLVISTGGGTFIYNRRIMLAQSIVVWLYVPLGVVVARIKRDKKRKRPLANAKIAELYNERQPLYARAHIRVNANHSARRVAASVRKAVIKFRES